MLLLVASSPNGSPGASASRTKRTRLMPSRLGSAMIRRLRTYFPIVVPFSPFRPVASQLSHPVSRFPVPACDLVQVVVPAGQMRGQIAAHSLDLRPTDHGQDVIVGDKQIVELDVHR